MKYAPRREVRVRSRMTGTALVNAGPRRLFLIGLVARRRAAAPVARKTRTLAGAKREDRRGIDKGKRQYQDDQGGGDKPARGGKGLADGTIVGIAFVVGRQLVASR